MIKILSNKFFICLFLLVTVLFVTSSCYASSTIVESPYSIQDFLDSGKFNSEIYSYDSSKFKYVGFYSAPYMSGSTQVKESYWLTIIYDADDSLSYIKQYKYGSNDYTKFKMYDKNNNLISLPYSQVYVNTTAYYRVSSTIQNDSSISGRGDTSNNPIFTDLTTVKAIAIDGSVLFDYTASVNTSFTYSFEGVKRGQCKLIINGLDSSLRMYGYVGLESYPDGETLDITDNIDNLRLLATKTDNSDLYCYLYEGEELLYYIVDENNKILDVGSINEMAKGYFLYGFNVHNGVDFVFLKDGQVYWDNSLSFKYSLENSNILFENNNIVSMASNSYIETDKTVASNAYIGFVYDSNNNLLSKAKSSFSNDLSSISLKVDTSYYEVGTLFDSNSCYWLQSIYLTGKDSSGNSIDFSNYYINWFVPTWVNFNKIELYNSEFNKFSGTLTGFTSAGALSMFNLKLFEYLSEHKNNFDITFQVYDGNDNLVLTHVVNSDDIVRDKVISEENNVDKGDYDILDNPNYTGGSSNSNNVDNIQDWTIDDYTSLISTDNFVWEFFKAILENLPWWIEVPLTILIFGVVIITLIRFIRGA